MSLNISSGDVGFMKDNLFGTKVSVFKMKEFSFQKQIKRVFPLCTFSFLVKRNTKKKSK